MNLETNENQNYKYRKEFREGLYRLIKESECEEKEKTPENIYKIAKQRGIKPTASYFSIEPSTVRYNIKKFKK